MAVPNFHIFKQVVCLYKRVDVKIGSGHPLVVRIVGVCKPSAAVGFRALNPPALWFAGPNALRATASTPTAFCAYDPLQKNLYLPSNIF